MRGPQPGTDSKAQGSPREIFVYPSQSQHRQGLYNMQAALDPTFCSSSGAELAPDWSLSVSSPLGSSGRPLMVELAGGERTYSFSSQSLSASQQCQRCATAQLAQ
mmetsp:Transcript_103827/g.334693  ORF Transcript_103827/g.334693 Transcript_103827/m.334693 type:complete len:105 (+) Transcript_103827:206-520(+)